MWEPATVCAGSPPRTPGQDCRQNISRFQSSLADVVATDPQLVAAELAHVAQHPQPGLTFAPGALGRFWETAPAARAIARWLWSWAWAAILAVLDLPMSTAQRAHQLQSSAPTLNVHLKMKMLQAAGIVTGRRERRTVVHSRTALGDALLVGAGGPQYPHTPNPPGSGVQRWDWADRAEASYFVAGTYVRMTTPLWVERLAVRVSARSCPRPSNSGLPAPTTTG